MSDTKNAPDAKAEEIYNELVSHLSVTKVFPIRIRFIALVAQAIREAGQGREELLKLNREQRSIIRNWQKFIERIAKPLGCLAITDDVESEIARLKAENAEHEHLANIMGSGWGHPSPCDLGPLCPYCEIDRLRAALDAAERKQRGLSQFAESYPCHCAENYPGSTEYHGHDCQNEIAQEFVAQFLASEPKLKPSE